MPPQMSNYSSRRNPRNCGPKVKTGCRTCKIRHVKCDEAKPECRKCKSTGRRCDYIDAVKAIKYLDTRNVSVSLPGSDEERRQLAFFAAYTARDLKGHFNEGFWDGLVLQVSFEVPALKHAVIALASLHESYKNGTDNRGSQPQEGLESTFAIKQYTKALGCLGKDLAEHKANLLVTVMACVVFICFDSLRGQFDSALVHIRSGMQLIRNLLRSNTISSSEAYLIRKNITPLFKRLWLQAIFFIDTRSPVAINEVWIDWIDDTMMPTASFTTFEEARNSINATLDATLHFYYTLENSKSPLARAGASRPQKANEAESHTSGYKRWTSSSSDVFLSVTSENPRVKMPLSEATLSRWRYLTDTLDNWEKKFDLFMKSQASSLSDKEEIRAATLLRIYHVMNEVFLKTSLREPLDFGNPFVDLTSRFERALELCRSLIISEQGSADSTIGGDFSSGYSTFSSDIGVIASLYFIAIKCTVSHLRWEAVSLLKMSKRREGMWDSAFSADICARIITLEETRDSNNHSSSDSDTSGGDDKWLFSTDATFSHVLSPEAAVERNKTSLAKPGFVQDNAIATELATAEFSREAMTSGWKSWNLAGRVRYWGMRRTDGYVTISADRAIAMF